MPEIISVFQMLLPDLHYDFSSFYEITPLHVEMNHF